MKLVVLRWEIVVITLLFLAAGAALIQQARFAKLREADDRVSLKILAEFHATIAEPEYFSKVERLGEEYSEHPLIQRYVDTFKNLHRQKNVELRR